jgi:hypothetical protein
MDHHRKFACCSNASNRPDEGQLRFATELLTNQLAIFSW